MFFLKFPLCIALLYPVICFDVPCAAGATRRHIITTRAWANRTVLS